MRCEAGIDLRRAQALTSQEEQRQISNPKAPSLLCLSVFSYLSACLSWPDASHSHSLSRSLSLSRSPWLSGLQALLQLPSHDGSRPFDEAVGLGHESWILGAVPWVQPKTKLELSQEVLEKGAVSLPSPALEPLGPRTRHPGPRRNPIGRRSRFNCRT